MSDVAEQIERLARQGRLSELTDRLLAISDTERRNLKPLVRKLLNRARRHEQFYIPSPEDHALPTNAKTPLWKGRHLAFQGARLAGIAALELSDLKKYRWSDTGDPGLFTPKWEPWRLEMLRLFEELAPSWIDDFAEFLLVQDIGHWFFVRESVRRGLCKKPNIPQYTFGMASELRYRWSTSSVNWPNGSGNIEDFFKNKFNSIREALLADPELLNDDVWKLFEHEGDSRCSLSALEAGVKPNDSWRETLVELTRSEQLSRERLLDKCLEGISRDYKPYYAAWFLGLHKSIKPVAEELVHRQARYLHLLGSSNPATTKMALDALASVQKHSALDAPAFVEMVEPVFRIKAKATVQQSLKLLAACIKAQPELAPQTTRVTLSALLNESPEVQEQTLEFLEIHADKISDFRPLLFPYRDSIAPSIKEKFDRLIGATGAPLAKDLSEKKLPAPSEDGPKRIDSIQSLDELLDRAAYVLEAPEEVQELDRVLDGISRLCDLRRPDMPQYAGALLQKCLKLSPLEAIPTWEFPIPMLGILLRSWIENKSYFPAGMPDEPTFNSFLVRRISALQSTVLNGASMPLFGAPTHSGGWIDPLTLVERARIWLDSKFELSLAETIAGLLRISQEGKDEALAQAMALKGELGDAIRYVLGDDSVAIGPSTPLWIAAARKRWPRADDWKVDATHPGFGPDASRVAEYRWDIVPTGYTKFPPFERIRLTRLPASEKKPTADFFPTLPQRAFARFTETWIYFQTEDVIAWRWALTIWPDGADGFLANGAILLANHSDTAEKSFYRAIRSLFEALSQPQAKPSPMSSLFLAFGCVAKNAEIRSFAIDSLIYLVNRDNLEDFKLGQPLAQLSYTKSFFYGRRLQTVLTELSRIGPLHSKATFDIVDSFLSSRPSPQTRELSKLLELYLELSIALGQKPSEKATSFLRSIPASPKVNKLVKALVGP